MQKRERSAQKSLLAALICKRTFGVTIFIALCLGLSIASWIKIPVEVMPREGVPPFLFLRVESKAPMSPERMELALTLPVEGVVRTLSGLIKFTTTTNGRGVSASLTYKPRTNLDVAEFNLNEALQDLEAKGLLDMRGVSISRMNPESSPVVKYSVTYDGSIRDPIKTIKEDLRMGLEAIPEVSRVDISGLEPPVFQFSIPLNKAREFGLEGEGLSSFLSFQPIRESLGEAAFGSPRFQTAVNARLLLSDLEKLKSQTVSRGSTLTLQQVASETVIEKARQEISRKNGEVAVFIEIFAKEGASLFDLDKHLSEYMAKGSVENGELSLLRFETIFNKSDDLKKAIKDVFGSLYEAVIITFIIVFLFLRQWRQTILISLSIPITLLMTILVMFARGESLNILTLSGLILGIGMVVDSAVLVVARVSELRAEGVDGKSAAGRGAVEVMSALVMSTLTNAAIFLPVAFIEGGDSFTDILQAFQLPILASLGASLVVALLFLPVGMIYWKERVTHIESEAFTHPSVIAFFRRMQKSRVLLGVGTVLMVIVVVLFVFDIKQTDIESPRETFSTLSVRFAPETGAETRKAFFDSLEQRILQEKSSIGYKFVVADFNPKFLSGSILFYPERGGEDIDKQLDLQEERLRVFIAEIENKPGIIVSLGFGGYASGSVQRTDVFRFGGPKMARLIELTDQLREQLRKVPGVEAVRLDKEESGERNLVFLPNDAVLLAYGLDLTKISHEISSVMSSASLTNLSFNGKPVGARITFDPPGGEWTMDSLRQMKIRVASDKYVNLIDLGQIVPMMFTRSISRSDGMATARVFVYYGASLDEAGFRNAQSAVRHQVQAFRFPLGYGAPQSDSVARIEDMQQKSQFIIYLSALLIYLLLAGMFESVLLPFAILFTVPLALLFGVAGLKAMAMDLDVMARLSLIILVGIGVNSAIILIDVIQGLRAEGIRREDAVVIGCARRLKAVLMTTAIQIISVLPVALGKAKIMGIPYASLGVSIISGMLLSTAVTLVVLPMVYESLDSVEVWIKRRLGLGATKGVAEQSQGSEFNESTLSRDRAA